MTDSTTESDPRLTVGQVVDRLDEWCPPATAETWDNVGLLLGRRGAAMDSVMTCLTLTEAVAEEAAAARADLIVTHHPILFRPVNRITDTTSEGRTVLTLLQAGVAVYSPHTAWDGATDGINEQLLGLLGLKDSTPLEDRSDRVAPSGKTGTMPRPGIVGVGRVASLSGRRTTSEIARQLADALRIDSVRHTGSPTATVGRIASACGSGGSLLPLAVAAGADALVTGEATFHQLLAAEAEGVSVFLVGHFASERFSLDALGQRLRTAFPSLTWQASEVDRDPVTLWRR